MEPVEATKLTVYTGDSFRYGRRLLYRAIVEMLHEEGIAGATVVHGIEGYGADKPYTPPEYWTSRLTFP